MNTAPEHSFACTKLYDPSGASITISFAIPVDAGVIDLTTANGIRESISNLLTAGFSVSAPGLEAGERAETIGAVSRRQTREGVDMIDLFTPNAAMQYKFLTIYLDTPEQVAEFTHATGLQLSSIPINTADGAINRESRSASQLLKALPAPVEIILKDNPKYNPDEPDLTKRKPKSLFVGWKAIRPTQASQPTTGATSSDVSTRATSIPGGSSEPAPEPLYADVWGITWADRKDGSGSFYRLTGIDAHDSEIVIVAFDTTALKLLGFDLDAIQTKEKIVKGYAVHLPYTVGEKDGKRFNNLDAMRIKADHEAAADKAFEAV